MKRLWLDGFANHRRARQRTEDRGIANASRNESRNRSAASPLLTPSSLSSSDEQDLVARARKGSTAAVEHLVTRYECRVFRLALNITRNHEDAEEAVQNAFVKAFENLDAFRGDSRFYTWLVRIAVNEALMKLRRRPQREVSIDDANDDTVVFPRQIEGWGPNPEERYSQEQLRQILERTICKLQPGYRTVFELRDVEGLSTRETAQALSLSVTVVKSRLSRARSELRRSLGVYFRRGRALGLAELLPKGAQRSLATNGHVIANRY